MREPPDRIEALEQDLPHQRREWRAQRVGWWGLSAFVAAASLGVFGGGPLSHATAASPDGRVRIAYDRFVRTGTAARMVIRVEGHPAGQALRLRIGREFLDGVRLERITPEPASVEVDAAVVTLHLSASAAGGASVVVDFEPLHAGRLRGHLDVSGGPALTFTQLAFF
jgi:hypothetical protein